MFEYSDQNVLDIARLKISVKKTTRYVSGVQRILCVADFLLIVIVSTFLALIIGAAGVFLISL